MMAEQSPSPPIWSADSLVLMAIGFLLTILAQIAVLEELGIQAQPPLALRGRLSSQLAAEILLFYWPVQ